MTELAGVQIDSTQGIIVAVLNGDLDLSNSRAIARDLTGSVPNEALGVVVDLCAVDYLDSSAVQMLFELAERLTARQQGLAFVVPEGSPLKRMLDIVALGAIAPIRTTRDAAEAELR